MRRRDFDWDEPKKSKTCIGKTSGEPLTEYDSREAADEGAAYANKTYRSNLAPYQCDKCGKWHLSPKSRMTPSTTCPFCKGSNGQPKEAYHSRSDAKRRANISRKERGVSLQVYKCEHSDTWHLTRERK